MLLSGASQRAGRGQPARHLLCDLVEVASAHEALVRGGAVAVLLRSKLVLWGSGGRGGGQWQYSGCWAQQGGRVTGRQLRQQRPTGGCHADECKVDLGYVSTIAQRSYAAKA